MTSSPPAARGLPARAPCLCRHQPRQAHGRQGRGVLSPLLRPGMRLLDVGCGPGSITAGLAKRVAPGETIGIDASQSVIDTARSLRDPALESLTFEVGSIYEPPFAPESFDAVFAHQVLQHLARPVDALAQMRKLAQARRRGRRARGRLGQRHVLSRERGHAPLPAPVLRAGASQRRGAERRPPHAPLVPRGRLRRDADHDLDHVLHRSAATREWADTYAERTLHSNLADKALEYGIATRSDLESMAAGWRTWGDHPDALYCFSHAEVVARRRNSAIAPPTLRQAARRVGGIDAAWDGGASTARTPCPSGAHNRDGRSPEARRRSGSRRPADHRSASGTPSARGWRSSSSFPVSWP